MERVFTNGLTLIHVSSRRVLRRAVSTAFACLSVVSAVIVMTPAAAQITLDGSFGRSGALSGPEYIVGSELGRQVGGNLFHSFGRFNLSVGERATFSGPESVSNIIGRVTGGSPSAIDGTVRSTIPGANLYLVNPAGMVFGPNARLDVQGAFHASTADYLALADGARVHATNPSASQFTSAPPAAFGFLGSTPASVFVVGSQLSVGDGRTLSIVAGDLTLDGATLQAPTGRLSLIASRGSGEVAVPGTDTGVTTVTRYGTIAIEGRSTLDTSGAMTDTANGSISIRGGRITISASTVEADNFGDAGAGFVSIRADDAVVVQDGSRIGSSAFAAGRAANLVIVGASLSIADSGLVTTSITSADAGDVHLTGTSVALRNTVVSGGSIGGRGGSITIVGGRIALSERTNLATQTIFGTEAGSIVLQATDELTLSDAVLVTQSFGAGRSGGIRMTGNSVGIFGASAISSNSFGSGAGGDITIAGSGTVTVDGQSSTVLISAGSAGSGNAGNLTISAGSDFLLASGFIDASTFGSGAGGSITLDAGRSVTLSALGSATTANLLTQTAGSGNAGDITIRTGDFTMAGQTSVQAATTGSGRGGAVRIAATGDIRVDNGGLPGLAFITSGTFSGGGTAAGVDISARSIELARGAVVSSQSFNSGAAGNIVLRAFGGLTIAGDNATVGASAIGNSDAGAISVTAGSLAIRDGGSITTSTTRGAGGNIQIATGDLLHIRGGRITTSVSGGGGGGGNIDVAGTGFVVLQGGAIQANAIGGNGGNIAIVAGNFIASIGSVVEATSQLGIDGTIRIDAPDIGSEGTLVVLPGDFQTEARLRSDACVGRAARPQSSLVIAGRGALPDAGDAIRAARYRAGDTPSLSETDPSSAAAPPPMLLLSSVACR